MAERDIVECRLSALLPLLERRELSDAEMEKALLDSRKDAQGKKPSVEALFHAYFLTLPGIEFVGHTHPQSVTAILCSPRARDFANRRIFPDEIVCCDTASVFVPYTDPGLPLARAIRKATDLFRRKQGRPPRVVLLENHGMIALGRTVEAVLASTLMAEKAATIWFGAAALGGPKSLKPRHVQRIAARPDEKIRQRELKL